MLVERLKVCNILYASEFATPMHGLQEKNTSLYRSALESLRTLIRTSTSSMTSVPKPLKFLRPHYPDLQALFETWDPSDDKVCTTGNGQQYKLTFCRVYLQTFYLSSP